ncbi:heme exporter protein CcmB [Sneathiella sp. P13V-1]|uniref:heme exporter protein CcmB n=1 Tax=Sneathiella sp. P13V-1 TaxID=2697366 RepID=UPI00187BA438|nr:heme exporter protein CcmB [Sneathiella sp. P13V-1]MBE7636286.1 heme exporter protein CcmB [Sneathiella sp. P13V-1]
MRSFFRLVQRDIQLAVRQGSALTMTLSFFVIAVTLFPLGVGPELNVLSRIGPGVLWVGALLSCMLTLDRIFQADYEDGTLEQLMLGPLPGVFLVLAKILAHWITSVLPLIVISPILAISLAMPGDGIIAMVGALLVGSPVLSLIGAVGAALTVAMRRGGVLLSILVLPLYIPVLIFGVAAVEAAIALLPVAPHIMLLGGLALGALVVCPLAAAAALRLAVE